MNKCKNCGADIMSDYKFCNNCGTACEHEHICLNCNAKILEGFAFCSICGTKVRDTSTTSTPSVSEPPKITHPPLYTVRKSSSTGKVAAIIIIVMVFLGILGILFLYSIGTFLTTDNYSSIPTYSSRIDNYSTTPPESKYSYSLNITLYNDTGVTIYYIYLSPVYSTEWEEDVLGDSVLLDGDNINISLSDYEGIQYWDLRIEDLTGEYAEWGNIDLFMAKNIYIYIDEWGYIQATWD